MPDAAVASVPRRRLLHLGTLATAVALLLAVGAGRRLWPGGPVSDREPAVAWLVNAQNCRWSDDVNPVGDMRAGRVLTLDRGLAEVTFRCGARVVIEGPARLELLSESAPGWSAAGSTARVPGPAAGFSIVSPQGKVIDLGTEFGVAVSDGGATDVFVFEGTVEALPAAAGAAGLVSLTQNQAARIADGRVTRQPPGPGGAGQFVRAIVPPPVIVPRTFRLAFDRPVEGTLGDANGLGIGLTHRLPGTGDRLPEADPQPAPRPVEVAARADHDQERHQHPIPPAHRGIPGRRLADLGFSGTEDFAVTAKIPNIPALESVGQFGLYAGAGSDRNIRGGLISRGEPADYTQFLVNNNDGNDDDICRGRPAHAGDGLAADAEAHRREVRPDRREPDQRQHERADHPAPRTSWTPRRTFTSACSGPTRRVTSGRRWSSRNSR